MHVFSLFDLVSRMYLKVWEEYLLIETLIFIGLYATSGVHLTWISWFLGIFHRGTATSMCERQQMFRDWYIDGLICTKPSLFPRPSLHLPIWNPMEKVYKVFIRYTDLWATDMLLKYGTAFRWYPCVLVSLGKTQKCNRTILIIIT